MAGAVVVLPSLNHLAICADFIPKDLETGKGPLLDSHGNPRDTFSLAASYPINKNLAIDAGFTTGTPLANAASAKANLLAGIKLRFSTR